LTEGECRFDLILDQEFAGYWKINYNLLSLIVFRFPGVDPIEIHGGLGYYEEDLICASPSPRIFALMRSIEHQDLPTYRRNESMAINSISE